MIVEMDKVYVQINVVENIVNKLQVGQEVEINVQQLLMNILPALLVTLVQQQILEHNFMP